jgi:hypothetical protein
VPFQDNMVDRRFVPAPNDPVSKPVDPALEAASEYGHNSSWGEMVDAPPARHGYRENRKHSREILISEERGRSSVLIRRHCPFRPVVI